MKNFGSVLCNICPGANDSFAFLTQTTTLEISTHSAWFKKCPGETRTNHLQCRYLGRDSDALPKGKPDIWSVCTILTLFVFLTALKSNL